MTAPARLLPLLAGLLVTSACAADELPPPVGIDELRRTSFDVTLVREGELESEAGFSAYLASYEHAGLTLRAMVAVPAGEAPGDGFPIVIANHGYVPDPRRYGIRADGRNARPGDYYASVPGLFATRGFLTVIPDYRGHNTSEGFEFVDPQDERSVAYYAEDVVALLSALEQFDDADTDNVFMWSHSMGGSVSIRVLLATDIVRASSFWSTMNVDEHSAAFDDLDGPVVIHHSERDTATPSANSLSFARDLDAVGRLESYAIYSGDEHYFTGDRRERAAEFDAAFFAAHMR